MQWAAELPHLGSQAKTVLDTLTYDDAFADYFTAMISQYFFPRHCDIVFWPLYDSKLDVFGLWTNHDIWERHLSPSPPDILQTTTDWLIEKIIITRSPSSLITLRSECRQAHMQTTFVILFTFEAKGIGQYQGSSLSLDFSR